MRSSSTARLELELISVSLLVSQSLRALHSVSLNLQAMKLSLVTNKHGNVLTPEICVGPSWNTLFRCLRQLTAHKGSRAARCTVTSA